MLINKQKIKLQLPLKNEQCGKNGDTKICQHTVTTLVV